MFMQTCSLTTYGVKLFAFGRLETSFITATATALCAHHVPHANSFHQFQFTFNSIAFDVKLHDIQLTERIRVCSVPIILLTHILTPDFYSVELQCAPFSERFHPELIIRIEVLFWNVFDRATFITSFHLR